MGYSTRNHGQIETFWPDETPYEFFIDGGATLATIIQACKDKWPDTEFEDIRIHSEYIHTDCLTYDLYDSGDYTKFIRIENNSI